MTGIPLLDLHAVANSMGGESYASPEEARSLRLAANVSVALMAAVVDASESSVLRWEGGRTKPRGFAATRYRRVLHRLAAGQQR